MEGHYPEVAYQAAFTLNVGLQIAAGIWFAAPICLAWMSENTRICRIACLRFTEAFRSPCHVRNQNPLGPDHRRLGLIVLLTIWGATEWTAWRLGFSPSLASPGSNCAGLPIYLPPAFFWWWFAYDAYAPTIFVEGAYIAASGGIISIAVAIGMSVWRAREAKNVDDLWFGALGRQRARSSSAGLLGADGVVLGQLERDYLRHDGPEHVLCFAPTRSGKGVGLVVPTLLTWPGSAHRSRHQGRELAADRGLPRPASAACCCSIRPTQKSLAYNPLLEVRRGEWEVRDVQNIADVLVDPEGALEKRNHWEKTSHALLVGAILHVLYAEPDKTLAGVADFLSDPKRPIETTLRGDDDDAASWRSGVASGGRLAPRASY